MSISSHLSGCRRRLFVGQRQRDEQPCSAAAAVLDVERAAEGLRTFAHANQAESRRAPVPALDRHESACRCPRCAGAAVRCRRSATPCTQCAPLCARCCSTPPARCGRRRASTSAPGRVVDRLRQLCANARALREAAQIGGQRRRKTEVVERRWVQQLRQIADAAQRRFGDLARLFERVPSRARWLSARSAMPMSIFTAVSAWPTSSCSSRARLATLLLPARPPAGPTAVRDPGDCAARWRAAARSAAAAG